RVLPGEQPGEVVLVGAGDVTLAAGGDGYYPGAASLDDLARQLKRTHPEPITTVTVDSSRYAGPTTAQGWDADVASGGYGAPVTPLAVDAARVTPTDDRRSSSPDLDTGRVLAQRLAAPGTSVRVELNRDGGGDPFAPLTEPTPLATVESPPISQLVEIMLSSSDNVIAESLARQVALAGGEPASFTGAAAAVRQALVGLGINLGATQFIDGSGLSRDNRLSTNLLAQLLNLAAQPGQGNLRSALTGLPVAGFTGTLHDRFDRGGSTAARSLVRAKTGSLSAVSSLAGTLTTEDGAVLAFAVIANGFAGNGGDTAERLLDELAATIAGCGCR
ncbi:MAG: D-alanyl-D-alanine carboxypeptidase/D-alanyl-D-alanine endopeptidase, partial [Mycobacteriales bacterium]